MIAVNDGRVEATEENIEKAGLVYHHTASRRGYVRVGDRGYIEPYDGKDGVVACVCIGCHRGSNRYAEYRFYTKKGE